MKTLLVSALTAAALGMTAAPAVMAAGVGDANRTGTTEHTRTGAMEKDKSGSVGQYVDDATVTTKVKAALASDDVTKAHDIDVETTKGVVVLSGEVESRNQIERASTVARGVEGVSQVRNQLTAK